MLWTIQIRRYSTQSAPSQVIATDKVVFRSTTLRDIAALKLSIDSLKFEIQELSGNLNKHEESVNELDCFLYLRLKTPAGKLFF